MKAYLYQPATTHARTGYGELFDTLSLALASGYPDDYLFVRPETGLMSGDPDVEIFMGQPYDKPDRLFLRPQTKATVRGVFTMYERPEMPAEFIRGIERYFDFIVVPSQWCLEVFTRVFPTHKIYLCPPAVDGRRYTYHPRRPDRQPFTVLWQGFNFSDRKGAVEVSTAFRGLRLDNARLILKMQMASSHSKVPFYLPDPKNAEMWVSDDCCQVEKLDLWKHCDFAVMPSRAEGIGMMPLEWMASGLPCAFSDNSGASDFCDTDYNYPLNCDSVYRDFDGIEFPIPSLGTIGAMIEYAYNHREDIAERAEHAHLWMRSHYSPETMAARFHDIVAQVRREFIDD